MSVTTTSTLGIISTITSNVTLMQTCIRIDPAGFEYVDWIWNIFGECVHDAREQSSFAIGMISLGFWIMALLPQVIANFKNRDASSLSTGYLIQITLGDASSMTAGIMSGQLITQILLSAYFVLMDVVMIVQYIIFVIIPKIYRKIVKKEEKNDDLKGKQVKEIVNSEKVVKKEENARQSIVQSSVMASILSVLVLVTFFSALAGFSRGIGSTTTDLSNNRVSRKLLHAVPEGKEYSTEQAYHNVFVFPPEDTVPIIGFSLGCFCAILYMGSRVPQIYLNYKRKTCDGLSPIYFAIGILGNICYNVSIWLYSSDSAYLMTRIPWLVESTVNIFLDLFIMWQFVYYDKIKKKPKENNVEAKNKELDTPTSSTISIDETIAIQPVSSDLIGMIKSGPSEFLITL